MKRQFLAGFSAILAMWLLIFSGGMVLHQHYCGGQLASQGWENQEPCCGATTLLPNKANYVSSPACCDIEFLTVDLDSQLDNKLPAPILKEAAPGVFLAYFSPSLRLYSLRKIPPIPPQLVEHLSPEWLMVERC